MADHSSRAESGRLASRSEWEAHVSSLKAEKAGPTAPKQEIMKHLMKELVRAVEKRIPPERFGLLLSGGVDSSLIAWILKKLGADFVCYSAGTENSRDVEEAREASKQMGLTLKYKIYGMAEAEGVIRKAAGIIGTPDVVNAGVAAVEIAAASLALKDGIRTLFGGLGSEEIFAGYQRHAEAEDVNSECWRGLAKMHGRDLVRDSKVASELKIRFLTPYLDADLIKTAMKIPGKYKISKGQNKLILREAALELGLPERFAFRKKIAAQYGSGFDRAMEKLSRKKGFKYKKDYLRSLL